MGVAKSRNINFSTGEDTITEYVSAQILDPQGLTINIKQRKISNEYHYDITMIVSSAPGLRASATVIQTITNNMVSNTRHTNNSAGIAVDYRNGDPNFDIIIGDGASFTSSGLRNQYAVVGDKYVFISNGQVPSYIEFHRDQDQSASRGHVTKILNNNINSIIIDSQTLIDGSDIGNTIFKIMNKKVVTYEKSCPKIVSVLKGKGNTGYQKLEDIFSSNDITLTLVQFGLNIMLYSMLRYILSKLLYNQFNINFLLRKYYNQFLKDLKKSEYRDFLIFFVDPNSEYYGYEKYFLYDNEK